MKRALVITLATVVLGCGNKHPPPKICESSGPPATPSGPLIIGMCMADPPPGASDAGGYDALVQDGSNDAKDEPQTFDAKSAPSAKTAYAPQPH